MKATPGDEEVASLILFACRQVWGGLQTSTVQSETMKTDAYKHPARFSVAHGVYFSPATNEGCVVLNVERGTVLSLNDTGTFIFSQLAEQKDGLTRDELVEIAGHKFEDVELARVAKAVDDLLSRLEKTGTVLSRRDDPEVNRSSLRGRLARRVPVFVRHLLRPLLLIKAYTCAALVLLFSAEAIQKLGGFQSVHRGVEEWAPALGKQPSGETLATACSAVNKACTWHPKRSLCLQRASVLVCLLRSLGFQAEMVIGVHKMPFYGHAWAEVAGEVVNDHTNAQKFFHVLSRC